MELTTLEEILAEKSGNKFCPVCGTPFKPYHSRQKTCGAPECQRQCHNEYMRERTKRQREENIEEWRKYHREAVAKSRARKRERMKRDAQLKDIQDRWEKQDEFDRRMSEYGSNYGDVQRQRTLASIPKIDVNLGGHNGNDNTEDN